MSSGRVQLSLTANGITRPVAVVGDLEAWFETKDFASGGISQSGGNVENDKQVKFWSGMIVEVDDKTLLAGMIIQVGLRNRLTDPVEWAGTVTVQNGNEPIWFPRPIHGSRYIRFRLQDSAVVGIWKITALELFGELDGGRM